MKKKRGAQPQNKNALQHGFYSAAFKARELRFLDNMPFMDLSAEIELIRVMNTRYLESVNAGSHTPDPGAQLSALRAVTLSAHAITSLLRLQILNSVVNKQEDELRDQLFSPSIDEPDDEPEDGSSSLSSDEPEDSDDLG
jgi:hypothetical protein